jgi:hypothetical protein
MKPFSHKLAKLAAENIHIAQGLLSTYTQYGTRISPYRDSVAVALRSVLEALSGVFCELARQQGGGEPTRDPFEDGERARGTPQRVRRYLTASSRILVQAARRHPKQRFPFTAMYLEAQTLMQDSAFLERRASRDPLKPRSKDGRLTVKRARK